MKEFVENIVFRYEKRVSCIGISLLSRDEWIFSVINARKKEDEVTIVSSFEHLKELKNSGVDLQKDIPVVVHIDGWGVLIKEGGQDNISIPVNNPDFFVREYPGPQGIGSYFSIIRTDLLNAILNFLISESIKVTGLSFGPFSVGMLAPFFQPVEDVKAGKWKFLLSNGLIVSLVSVRTDPEVQYDLAGDKISSNLLPLYGALIAFFSGDRDNNPLTSRYRNEFVYGRLIKYMGIGALILILSLLLINYFIWDNLRHKNSNLVLEISQNEQFISKLSEKKKELMDKEDLVNKYIGTMEKTHYSWFADRLASSLPAGIRLTILDIQPLSKKLKPEIAIIYQTNRINVEGDAGNLTEITDWVKAIGVEKWIRKVELVSFSRENEKGLGHFKLQIDF